MGRLPMEDEVRVGHSAAGLLRRCLELLRRGGWWLGWWRWSVAWPAAGVLGSGGGAGRLPFLVRLGRVGAVEEERMRRRGMVLLVARWGGGLVGAARARRRRAFGQIWAAWAGPIWAHGPRPFCVVAARSVGSCERGCLLLHGRRARARGRARWRKRGLRLGGCVLAVALRLPPMLLGWCWVAGAAALGVSWRRLLGGERRARVLAALLGRSGGGLFGGRRLAALVAGGVVSWRWLSRVVVDGGGAVRCWCLDARGVAW